MVRIYKILTTLIFIYAVGHFIYPVIDNSGLTSREPLMWFLSGGLAVLFSGFINLSYLIVGGNFTKRISIATNATILFFMLVLCVVIPEIQVFILATIYLLTLIVTATISLTAPTIEATFGTNE
jgi:hypothetical protein